MSKVVCMIPARLGSQRVPKKNLRMLGGKPLIAYSIECANRSGVFDEIYVNSEADIIGQVATEYGARFYKRPAELSSHTAVNDGFALDFIKNVPGDALVQFLPTSPLISPEEVRAFVAKFRDGGFDALVSVESHQIACLHEGRPINFSLTEPHRPSQTMTPVQSYATVLMAWTYESFLSSMKEHGCAYHGGTGKVGYHELAGLSTIDIDNEEEFELAEVALAHMRKRGRSKAEYYEPAEVDHSEEVVPEILEKDGVMRSDFEHENRPLANPEDIIAGMDNSVSWCYRIVNTENNSATLISQLPGEGNRLHYHPDWNEWWYIVSGQWKWLIEGEEILVNKGDLVFIEKGKHHSITATGDEPAVRLAVSRDLVRHVYPSDEA